VTKERVDPAAWVAAAVQPIARRSASLLLPTLMRRALRRNLGAVWVTGATEQVGPGSFLLLNHHSWWDAYLAWWLAERFGAPLAALTEDVTVDRFPFFLDHGSIRASEPRKLVRRIQEGALGVIFGEGAIRPPSTLSPLAPGAVRLARMAGVPLTPVALRVAMRGFQYPEAYITFLEAPDDPEEAAARIDEALLALDHRIATEPAEEPLAGFELWLRGAASTDAAVRGAERWWR